MSDCYPNSPGADLVVALSSAATDVSLIVDRAGTVKKVTLGDGFEGGVGWRKLVGMRWADTLATDSQEKAVALLKEVVKEGRSSRPRECNQKVEGIGSVPLRYSAIKIDRCDNVAVLGRDLREVSRLQQRMLTAQQAMDREYNRLRQADTQYRVFFQVASDAVVVCDASTLRILEVNPAAAELCDETAEAMRGQSFTELLEPKGRGAVQAFVAAVEAGGRPDDVKLTLKGKVQVQASALLFRQLGSALILFRFRRPHAEQSGPRSSRLLTVLEALPDGVVVTGEDRRILNANPAFCELVNCANEKQLLGHPLDRYIGREGVDLKIMLSSLRESGSVRNFATVVHGAYGPPQEAMVSAVSALDAAVPCLGFSVRPASARVGEPMVPITRSAEQLRQLVGSVSLRQIVRESSDLIEKLCIEAALDVSHNNRASAAQLLGLSRQSLYSKLRRYGFEELDH
ncbi:MAG: transcriptional regulator PpsR [Myxococcaceae bacterium]|nr:transcriptional regulator PpsR [Myxococcaceae bacterium]